MARTSMVAAVVLALAVSLGTAAAPTTGAVAAGRPLVTGVMDPVAFASANAAPALRRVKAAGAGMVVLQVSWADVAPAGATEPAGFDATDPGDPLYRWATVDRQVRLAVAAGLQPLLILTSAPRWAQPRSADAPFEPDAAAYGDFALAAATRYDGHHFGLPRVRYWQAWNEPNITTFLMPQYYNHNPFSPGLYRRMVNAFTAAVHAAAPGNVSIAGGVAPFADRGVSGSDDEDWGPLRFMRFLFCLDDALRPTCSDPVRFDAWSIHPYTSGGPHHSAYLKYDISLGDLPEVRAVLDAAVQRSRVIHPPSGHIPLWVTEFSWDSAPPDPQAVPMSTLMQWVPEALHVMWQNGISHVMWFTLRDRSPSSSVVQSGLYFNGGAFRGDRPKPLLAAFRFPFAAEPQAAGFRVWGRTPTSQAGKVLVQTTTPQGWRTVAVVSANRYGIFQGLVRALAGVSVRAVVAGTNEASARFPVQPIPDHFYNPFGSTPPLEKNG